MNKFFYSLLVLDIVLSLPFVFYFLPLSPSIPMLLHYLILGLSIFISYKNFNLDKRYLFLGLPIIVFWHLPWLFDLATSFYYFWILDVISLTLAGYLVGGSIKKFSINSYIFLFSLWMVGDSLLSYMWIIGYPLYASPYSIYPRYEFPAAGTIIFVVMDLLAIFILLKLFFAKIFTN